MRRNTLLVLAFLLVAIILFLLALRGCTDDDGPAAPPTVTVEVGGPHGTPETELEVPAGVVAQAKDVDDHDGLKDETPLGVDDKVLDDAREQQDRLAANDQLPIVSPNAAPQQRGCTTRLVQNFSSRRGVRPRLQVLHYTVSANRPGPDDVRAIIGLFDRPSFQASSHYIIDNEGNCAYIVREPDKAWTQAAANPVSISYELINSGSEPTYAGTRGLAKLALVLSDSMRRWEIPLQRGSVSGCTVTRPGIIDHKSLGPCGGGHRDIEPPFSIENVIRAVRKVRGTPTPTPPPPDGCAPTVTQIQRALQHRGHRIAVDGTAGAATLAAIRAFQANNGISPTGRVGRPTAEALGLC